MAAAFPHAQVTQETYAVYARLLGDIPVAELQAAALQCLAKARFMPTIGEIRDTVLELRALAADDGAPDAHTAWAEVRNNARYSSSDFSHPRIAEAARCIGGMKMLGMASDGDMVAHRARFIEAYEGMANREQRDAALLPAVRAALGKMQQQRPALGVDREE